MAGPATARPAALDILRAVRSGGLADRALERVGRQLDPRERALAHELAYGVLRLRGRLDHRLEPHSKRPLNRLDPDILDILRLGAYQLTELGGVPEYAAVSESVELAKRARRSAAGFVNGVLQSLRRAPDASTFPTLAEDPVAHLVTWGSHPRWLVERWIARFGAEVAARLTAAANERPDLYVRVLGADRAGARRLLEAAGATVASVPFLDRALRVVEGSAAAVLAAAPVIVQDPAAGLVVSYIGPVPGRVLDLAAAPGGKALALAADTPDPVRIVVAADLSQSRMRRLRENAARLARPTPEGLGPIGVAPVVADGRRPPFRAAPLVLVDAPCTGTGTLRRHPDGKWRIGPEDLRSLVRVQRELLEAAAGLVMPGGLLVYSTCSLEAEENEMQVTSFLERHDDFHVEPGAVAPGLTAGGMLHVLPHVHGVDGAFAARLRRRG